MATRSLGCAAVALIAMLAVALPASAQLRSKKRTSRRRRRPRSRSRRSRSPAFDHRDPDRRRFGMLDFRGGLVLTSPFREFGGISSINVAPDGANFIAATDRSWWLRGRITYSRHAADRHRRRRDGADARARRAHAARRAAGTTPRRWRATATRSMSASSACTGSCGSISARKACWRAARPIEVPAAFRVVPEQRQHRGAGVRAARLRSARRHADRDRRARARPRRQSSRVPDRRAAARARSRSSAGTTTTSATPPSCRAATSSSWSASSAGPPASTSACAGFRLRRSAPGALVDGAVLFEADLGQQIDNMEGISVHRAGGETVLTLISDNNFSACSARCCCSSRWRRSERVSRSSAFSASPLAAAEPLHALADRGERLGSRDDSFAVAGIEQRVVGSTERPDARQNCTCNLLRSRRPDGAAATGSSRRRKKHRPVRSELALKKERRRSA